MLELSISEKAGELDYVSHPGFCSVASCLDFCNVSPPSSGFLTLELLCAFCFLGDRLIATSHLRQARFWVLQKTQNEAPLEEGEEIKTVSSRFLFIALLEWSDNFMKQTWDDLFLLVECNDIQDNMGCSGLNKALCRLTCLTKRHISRINYKRG